MKNILCFFGIHDWNEWDEPVFSHFTYVRGIMSDDFFAGYSTQRDCKRCHRFKWREVSEREIQAKKDYEFTTFMLKKSRWFAERENLEKANWYLGLAEAPYKV